MNYSPEYTDCDLSLVKAPSPESRKEALISDITDTTRGGTHSRHRSTIGYDAVEYPVSPILEQVLHEQSSTLFGQILNPLSMKS